MSKTASKAKALRIVTTETEGAVESFDYDLDFDLESYIKSILMFIQVHVPKNLKYNNMTSLNIILEGEVDTKETEGTGWDFINIRAVGSASGWVKRTAETFQSSGKQKINNTFQVSAGVNVEEKRYLRIYYRREFTNDDLVQWKLKRNTG